MTAAALGTALELPTLEADVVPPEGATTDLETSFELDVRPGTQSGTEQVLRGRGVPGLRGGRGDLVVTIAVETPTRLDPRQEELLRELAAIRGEEQPAARLRPGQARARSAGSATRSTRTDVPPRPPGAVPGRGGRGRGGDRRGRRGAPRGRRTPARGRRAGRCSPTGSAPWPQCEVTETGKQRLVAVVRVDDVGAAARARAGRRAGAAQGRPRRARRRGADRDRRGPDRARGRPSRSVAVWRGDRAAKSLARVAGDRPRGRQAGPAGRGSPRSADSPRPPTSSSSSPVRRSRWCCTRRRPSRWPRSTSRPPGRSCSWSVPRAGWLPTSSPPSPTAGARTVRLGAEVLRTSTAGVAAVAALLSRTDRWGRQGRGSAATRWGRTSPVDPSPQGDT